MSNEFRREGQTDPGSEILNQLWLRVGKNVLASRDEEFWSLLL